MRFALILTCVVTAGCAASEAEPERAADAAHPLSAPAAAIERSPERATAPAVEPTPAAPLSSAVDDGLPQPVKPFPGGLSGELLFQSDREGPTRLYVLDLGTATVRRVGGPGNWADEEPAWSHDGRRIAFSSTRGQAGNFDIFVMDADGGNVIRLTDHRAPEQDPVWAADDQSLFFTAERDGRGEIYRVWLADRRVERVTSGFNRAIMPATSPDGRYLAYAAQTLMYFQLHLLDLTSGTSRQITAGAGSCRPSFAPDSQEIAFVRMDPEPSRLEAVREAGPRILLQDQKRWAYYPDYSPDGRWLAFSMSPEHHEGEDWDLALMDMQKPGQFIYLTKGRGNDRVPDWRPR
jgi:dipeptidyl aminopeptidase/acylaminoacyl peptidase